MLKCKLHLFLVTALVLLIISNAVIAQIGRRFPSERKVIKDPVTGVELVFLTSMPVGDWKIYQTQN